MLVLLLIKLMTRPAFEKGFKDSFKIVEAMASTQNLDSVTINNFNQSTSAP